MTSVSTKNGTIDYEVQGAGPSLVLINGMGFGRWGFFKQVPALSRRFATITFEAREGRDPEGVIEGLASDVVGLLDHLGVNRAHLLGTPGRPRGPGAGALSKLPYARDPRRRRPLRASLQRPSTGRGHTEREAAHPRKGGPPRLHRAGNAASILAAPKGLRVLQGWRLRANVQAVMDDFASGNAEIVLLEIGALDPRRQLLRVAHVTLRGLAVARHRSRAAPINAVR